MDYKKIFWGVILIAFGAILILKNLGVLFFTWHSVWHLWPVLLILWGISVLPVKDVWKLLISFLAIILSVLIFYRSADPREGCSWNFCWKDKDNTMEATDQRMTEPYDTAIRTAVLKFDAAAGSFHIKDTTNELVAFKNRGDLGTYSMEIERKGDTAVVDLKLHAFEKNSSDKTSKADVKLNSGPLWDLYVEAGAAKVDMDLSPFQINKLDFEGGASSIELHLGTLQKMTTVKFEAGATSIKMFIPKEAGCEVITETFLTGRHLQGFTKTADHTFRTDNFNTSLQKINIRLEAAISSLDVVRY